MNPSDEVRPPGMKATVYRVLPCPVCGRQWSLDPGERARAECCGNPLPLERVILTSEVAPPVPVNEVRVPPAT